MTLETGGNKEWSKQSNCSILQSTNVGSAKEHDQVHLKSPESGSTKQHTPLQAKLSNLKEVGYPPVELNIPQQHIFLTSIPGSLGLEAVPRRYQTFKGINCR